MALGAFLDTDGAFNNVPTISLMNAPTRRNIPHRTCNWIEASLRNRVIRSTLSEDTVEANVGRGCPQGGALLPLYWVVLVDDLLAKMTKERLHCGWHSASDQVTGYCPLHKKESTERA